MAELLSLQRGEIGYGPTLFRNAELSLRAGTVTAVVGPNGSGKTALLQSLACQLPLKGGQLSIQGQLAQELSTQKIASAIAVVPQFEEPLFGFSVREIVEMGRLVHLKGLWPNAVDHEAIDLALQQTELTALQTMSFLTLSGGEKQRVLIARALAQQTPIILMDEPTNHLDSEHYGQLQDLLKSIGTQPDRAVLLCTHEMDFASQVATEFFAIDDDQLIPRSADETLEHWVHRIYGKAWQRVTTPQGEERWIRNYRTADSSSNH